MRARSLAARVAVTVGAGLLAAPLVALAGSQAESVHARLRVTPNVVRVGDAVLLDASRSTARGAHIVAYRWDLDGNGTFEKRTGKKARVRQVLTTAGVNHVAVKVRDDRGDVSVQRVTIETLAPESANAVGIGRPPTRQAAPDRPVRERATGVRSTTTSTTGKVNGTSTRLTPETVGAIRRGLALAATTSAAKIPPVHSASTTSVQISGFKFKPSSVSVHVGDTVTWVNNDSAPHTATADSGKFDTAQLKKGQSGSFTFKNAGTYNYICSLHPFMKASVTVTGSSSGGSGSSGSNSPSGSTSSNGSSSSNNSSGGSSASPLPHTGLEVISLAVSGLALLGLGLVLRRGVRYRPDASRLVASRH